MISTKDLENILRAAKATHILLQDVQTILKTQDPLLLDIALDLQAQLEHIAARLDVLSKAKPGVGMRELLAVK